VENPAGLPYVPGQLLVRYHEPSGIQPQDHLSIAAAVQASFQLTLLQDGGGYGPDLVQVPSGQDVRTMAKLLSADPRVKYAEPNYFLYTLATRPNDPRLDEQWNMLNFGLPQAWGIKTGSESFTIAIIDTGVDTRHEDLAGRFVLGCDFGDRDNDPNPDAGTVNPEFDPAHGTHVAGIAAATGNNRVGVAGVAYRGVEILPVKVSNSHGRIYTDVVADAILWAAGLPVNGVNRNPHPARIINISLGAPRPSQALNDAVAAARRAGAIVVAAAGNTGRGDGILAPANAPDAIAVGSVDNSRQRSSFSSFNTTGRTVDLMAPGGRGPGPLPVGVLSTIPGNQYSHMQGTSMAAPFVAGVAALIWSQNPRWSNEQVIAHLKNTTYPGSRLNPAEYGRGIVCADAALGAPTTCGR
jgi:serine protease